MRQRQQTTQGGNSVFLTTKYSETMRKQRRKLNFLAVALLVTFTVVRAEDTVVLGRLVENEPMEYVTDECPEGYICLRSWWKSVIRVDDTVKGPSISGRVSAAVMQHTRLNPAFRNSVRLFVLRPIIDPQDRAKLRVEYFLEEMSLPSETYCFSRHPMEYGLETEEVYSPEDEDLEYHCFELPQG